MDFETFKEDLANSVKEKLDARFGSDTTVELHKVDKMNETYEAITVKGWQFDVLGQLRLP